ncbi:hypothetical protein DRN75_03335 [Nanoarchaeota archaeon]|nr:MAG: hypothetical protein DRN75_03335 [Nanoarchaeota archaeon]
MRAYWDALSDSNFYRGEIENINQIRDGILRNSRVAVRKTFGLNKPGCSVNCNYCTLGTQYVGSWNGNRILDGVEASISEFYELLPNANIELVGYWHGINNQSPEFERLLDIVRNSKDYYQVVGGDLGIILDEVALNDLREAGLTYLHNNLETSQRLYPRAIGRDAERFEQKIETLQLANACGLRITSGVLIGLGENIEDMIEQVYTLQELPLRRVAVNFMDYETDPRIGERFRDVREQLTPEYALRVLAFLRRFIDPDQSLMVGCGVSRYLYDEQNFLDLLNLVDTIHIGSFINLREGSNPIESLLSRLNELGYDVVQPRYFE